MMKFYTAFCLSLLMVGSAQSQSAPQVHIKEPLVEANDKVFGSHKITVLVRGAMQHKQIKNNSYSIDHWVLRNPSVVKIGEKVYVKGTAENGPINMKGKVIMFDMAYVQLIMQN